MAFSPGLAPRALVGGEPTRARAWFVVHPKGLVVRQEGGSVTLPTDADVAALGVDRAQAIYFGHLDDADAYALPFDGDRVAPPFATIGLFALSAIVDAQTYACAGRATHLADWATTTRFCGRCGTPTAPVDGERCAKCPACALALYPRIAPAIIVLVRRGERALLARSGHFPPGMYSTLAGFSEIGESLEETLVREVFEEVGVRVTNVRYFGSQPWPFPHSLMIGFTAEWQSGDIAVDGTEILDARWFEPSALPGIPPRISIARRLIDAWLDEVGQPRA